MNNLFKIGMGALAVTAATSFAGQYPFPQNMKHPNGHIIEYASTNVIKEHYNQWKKAWYNESNGWIYAPEGTDKTVSEAIAYGMLISVYMDDESMFKKVYNVWTSNAVSNGGGMNWQLPGGSGTASDADFDAALALVMASKQWNSSSYLNDAKALIDWIADNDFESDYSLKPGNQWNQGLNPSYVMPGHFRLFEKVTNNSKWSSIRSKAMKDLLACQDSKTGLVPDWCDWDNHKPKLTSAAVSNDIGFYDDAARTPWRTAWAYYWYGDSDAKTFNETVVKWLIPNTRTASGVNSGYSYTNNSYIADESEKRNFVSSTFSGGLGLAASSIESNEAKTYLTTVYKVLKEKKSCSVAQDCGVGSNVGEKYYPATLNMLYLLILTGNMPNLYDLTGFEKFTPDTTKAPSVSKIEGEQQKFGDSTVSVSGFWNWGAYHDKLEIGTKMMPDSGASPLFKKADGSIYAEASMEIGPEPEWTAEKAANGELKYPSAGIAMSFKSDACKKTKTCGVNLKELGVKYLRVTLKTTGPIRMAILNTITDENEEKKIENAGAGTEPGIYVDNTDDYKAVTYDLTPNQFGFDGLGAGNRIDVLDWVNMQKVPSGEEIIEHVKGLKWEVKDAKGGLGELSIKSIEFLDANEQLIDPSKITGMTIQSNPGTDPGTNPGTDPGTNPGTDPGTDPGTNPGTDPGTNPGTDPGTNPGTDPGTNPGTDPGTTPEAILMAEAPAMAKITVAGMNIAVNGAKAGADIAVFSLQGKKVASTKAFFGNASVTVPTKGIYLVRVNGKLSKVTVK